MGGEVMLEFFPKNLSKAIAETLKGWKIDPADVG